MRSRAIHRNARARGPSAALTVLLLAACASAPPPEPEYTDEIRVTPLEVGRMYGGRAQYLVDAPLATVRELILDFEAQAEFRPMILEATSVSRRNDGGEVVYRFRGLAGIDPNADCRYEMEGDGDRFDLTYEMTDSSMALWGLNGGFSLRAVDGGRKTLVRQEFLLSAIMMDRRRLLEDLRLDAAAIRARAETRARED